MKSSLIALTLAIAVTGCTFPGGGKFSSEHGYSVQGEYENGRFIGAGVPTIVPDGYSAMGSRQRIENGLTLKENMYSTITNSDGSSATGEAADIIANVKLLEQMLLICAVAPQSDACAGRTIR